MRKRPRAGRNAYVNRPRNIGEAVAFLRFHFTSHLSAGDLRGRGTLQCPPAHQAGIRTSWRGQQ